MNFANEFDMSYIITFDLQSCFNMQCSDRMYTDIISLLDILKKAQMTKKTINDCISAGK